MKKKRWLGILLTAIMVLTMAPTVAFAADDNPVKIGDKEYASMEEAVAAVPTDGTETTIVLQKDYDGNGVVVEGGRNIVFDLGGNTWTIDGTVGSTGTETNGMQLLKGSTVTIKNGTITSEKAIILIQKYCDLTLENVVLDGSKLAGSSKYTLSNNNGKTIIRSGTKVIAAEGGVAFDVYYWPDNGYDSVSVTVHEGAVIDGTIEYADDGTVDDEVVVEKAKLDILGGEINGDISTKITNASKGISISGGTFNSNVSKYMDNAILVRDDSNSGIYTAYALDGEQSGDDFAIELGAAYKKDGVYYYTEPSDGEGEKIAYQIILHYTSPDRVIGEKVIITVPIKNGATVEDGNLEMGAIPVIPNESEEYKFAGWYNAVLNEDRTAVAEYKGDALTLDTVVTGDMELYGAWEKVGQTVSGAEDKPTDVNKDNADKTPETGDDSNMTIPFVAAGLALAVMAAVVATRKRHG